MIITWLALLMEAFICFPLEKSHFTEDGLEILGFIVVMVNVMIAFIELKGINNNKKICMALLCGFVFRLLLLVWEMNFQDIFTFPDYPDSYTFMVNARNAYNGLPSDRGGTYSEFVANWIYTFFGVQPMIAKYVNILFAMSTIILVSKIMNKSNADESSKLLTVSIMCFLPYYAMDNVLMLREAMIQFLITLSLFIFIKWMENGKQQYMIIAIAVSLFGASFHDGAIAPALAYIVCWVLYDSGEKKFRFKAKTIVLILIAFFAFQAVNATLGDVVFKKFDRVENAEDIMSVADSYNAGGAAYSVGISSGNAVVDMIVNTPLRMFYFVFSPVPWMWRGFKDILSFFCSAALYGYTYYLAAKCLRMKYIKNRNLIILGLIIAIASALVFAWGVSNAGAAMRHRDKFVGPYLLLLGLCANELYAKGKGIFNFKK